MRPVGEACSLPFAAYRDEAFFALEMERIYRRDWVAVCAEASLSAPGDYLAIDIGGEPVALVRGSDARLRALSNVCRHRGTLLLEPGADHLEKDRIVCPYHAWSYSDTGAFRGAPYSRGVAIDSGLHSLPSFRVETWMGVVFVCLSDETPPPQARLAEIAPHLAEFDMESFTVAGPLTAPEIWAANWKLVVENAMESYHLFQVHADTLEKVTPTRGAYYIEGSAAWTLTGGAIVQAGGTGLAGKLLAGLLGSNSGGDHYTLVSIPPSFVGVVTQESWGLACRTSTHPYLDASAPRVAYEVTHRRYHTGSLRRIRHRFSRRGPGHMRAGPERDGSAPLQRWAAATHRASGG